jgi:hypothetical protein
MISLRWELVEGSGSTLGLTVPLIMQMTANEVIE